MASPYDQTLEQQRAAKLKPQQTGVTANPNQTRVNGANALASAGRMAQQSAVNFSGTGQGAQVKQGGVAPPPRNAFAPPPGPAQPAQVQNRMFRNQQAPRQQMIQQMAQPAPRVWTNSPAQATGPKQNMAGGGYGFNQNIANIRDGAVMGIAQPTRGPSLTELSGGGGKPMHQGGAGSVQTRQDAYIAGEGATDPNAASQQAVGDQRAFGQNGGYESNRGNTNTRHGWWNNGTGVELGPGGAQLVGDGVPGSNANNNTGNMPGSNAGGGGAGGPASGAPEDIIEWLTSMGLNAASGAIGPSADFANKLNNATRPELLNYFGNFKDLDNNKAAGDRFMDPETYKQFDDLQREQLSAEVGKNRDAMMRTALTRQAGGGRGMAGDFAGQVMDASNRSITEGNRQIGLDSFNRQLQGTSQGAQMKQNAQAMIYDLMNQGRTDPREILAYLSEVAPELVGHGLEFIGGFGPG